MIYLVAPNAVHPSGGVGVAAQWVRLLIEHGHEAMFITPNGDPSPYWLNFTVPAGSYADMVDIPENKRVDIWMDCMMEYRTHHMRHFFFAQDVCQLEHIAKEHGQAKADRYRAHLAENVSLITIGAHSRNYYLYRFGIPSKVVNNWVDTDLFNIKFHRQVSIGMMRHRDHYNPEIHAMLEGLGWTVSVAQGTQAEIAEDLGYRRYFISDVRGRFDGFANSEGFPLPIAEAMASGCVVLCRDTGGVREYLMDRVNGLFYKDITEIPALLKWAEVHPHFSDLSEAAQNAFYWKFTRENAWVQIKEALEL
jgi:hypothetical protein